MILIVKIILKSWSRILVVLALTLLIPYFALPRFFSISWVRNILESTPSLTTGVIVSVALFLLLAAVFQGARSVWKRYHYNYEQGVALFTFPDAMMAALASVVLYIFLLPDDVFVGVAISSTSRLWWQFTGTMVFLWAGLVRFLPVTQRTMSLRKHSEAKPHFGDDPIVSEDKDLLGRLGFITGVYDRIASYDLSESHVFGLYGAWGEGKTSVLNLLKNRFRDNSDFILVEFDPWYYSSNEAIVSGFFDTLLTTINQSFFFPGLKRALIKYGDVLGSGVNKVLGVDLHFWQRDESVAKLRERVQTCIQQTGKRLLIVIDDIDRLQNPTDMFMVLRLVKLAGNFENTIFVLSFDPRIVMSAVNQTKDKDFLEKIVQSPIDLPAVEQTKINAFFCVDAPGQLSQITRLAEELGLTSSQQDALRYGFVEHYINWMSSAVPYVSRCQTLSQCSVH